MGTKYRPFRIPEELDDKFQEIMKALDKNATETFIHLLEAYLGRDSNQYQFLDEACPALQHLDEGFHCCFKVPRAKPWKLGEGNQDDARKICSSCNVMKPLREAAEEAAQLRRSGYTVDIPYCAKGGKVSENLKAIWCPLLGNERPIEVCNKIKCDYIRVIHADARLAASRTENKK